MHIPDGFLNIPVAGVTTVIATVGAGLVHIRNHRCKVAPSKSQVGLVAAFIFMAQMVNFPVAMGTSGHLVGTAIAAILLGPLTATLVITGVLVIQCLLLHDGGLTTLGANVINMALIGVWSAWFTYHLAGGDKRPVFSAAMAGWVTVVVGALFCAAELVLSNTIFAALVFPAMLSVHALIGLGEGLISALIIFAMLPQTNEVPSPNHHCAEQAKVLMAGIVLLIFMVPFSCSWPDGLESTARQLGFHHLDGVVQWKAIHPTP